MIHELGHKGGQWLVDLWKERGRMLKFGFNRCAGWVDPGEVTSPGDCLHMKKEEFDLIIVKIWLGSKHF